MPAGANFSLSPANVTVNSTVSAAGTGFPANSTIYLNFGQTALNSTCHANSTGALNNSHGRDCTIQVPPLPGGANSIVASADDWHINATSPVPQAGGVDYDAAKKELFVTSADPNADELRVLSSVNGSLLASAPIYCLSYGIAVDPLQGEVYLACAASVLPGIVEVFNDTNDSWVGNISVGQFPTYEAFDSGTD